MPAFSKLARATMLALVAMPGMSFAGTFGYALFGSIEHSDNIALTTSNPTSTNIITPGVNFAYQELGSSFQANVVGTLEYIDYTNSQYDSQTRTTLTGQANWSIMPQRLDFTIEDDAGIQPVDTLASNAPDNQQQTNVLALGPVLHFNFNEATRGQAEVKYFNSYASKVDDFDSSRGLGAFRVIRDVSPTTQVSLNAESQRVDFRNNTSGPDYTRNSLYGHYVRTLRDFDVDALLGWTYIDFNNAPSASKPMARVTLGWRPNLSNSFSLMGVYEYSDAAQDMLLQPGQKIVDSMMNVPANPLDLINDPTRGINTGSMVVDAQVYLDQSVQATYSYHVERLTLTVAPLYRKLSYVNNPTFDQTERNGAFSLDYKLRPTLLLSTFLNVDHTKYHTIDRTDKDYRFGAALSHQFTDKWSWRASYTRQLRNSTVAGQSYHENEYMLSVIYHR